MNLLKVEEVEAKTGLDKATIRNLVKAGKFPPGRRAAARAVRWIDTEIDEWIGALPPAVADPAN